MAHCPLSNAYFSEKSFRLREALDLGVMVGLGTDIAGGYSTDIMNSMRHAVATSRTRQGARFMQTIQKATEENKDKTHSLAVTWMESLYLATRGGALALGLKDVGEFKLGARFDAQESTCERSTDCNLLADASSFRV